MVNIQNLSPAIFWLGVNDLETKLFESLWPIPNGISYNSYFIVDDKNVLIDTVKEPYIDLFLDRLNQLTNGKGRIDYLVINHIEPDHSGAIKLLKRIFPEITIIGNSKTKDLLQKFYKLDEIMIVDDGDTLKLGKHKLKFVLTPMVHWPETMMTLEEQTGTLFSGDVFGGFGGLSGSIFQDQQKEFYQENETSRYFTNVIAKYSIMVEKALAKIATLAINQLAPAHGPVWRKDISRIIDLYGHLCRQESKKGAVIVYASMYGNTKLLAEEIASGFSENSQNPVKLYDISKTHMSYILNDVWQYEGLILGGCTYNTELFPLLKDFLALIANKPLTNRKLGIFSSHSWNGGAEKDLLAYASASKLQLIEPVITLVGAPGKEDFEVARNLGKNVALALR
ncbi:MAG: FprA family A-type flavoprotein [Candidatus Margulisbacteria bacterium]|nr:FprA family A-type flavoprotein [Candidatus Margulisiibacteriota bacterium]